MFNNFLGISALAHTGRLTWLELTHLTTLLLRFGVSIMTNEESHVVTKRAIRNLCCLSSIFFSKIVSRMFVDVIVKAASMWSYSCEESDKIYTILFRFKSYVVWILFWLVFKFLLYAFVMVFVWKIDFGEVWNCFADMKCCLWWLKMANK